MVATQLHNLIFHILHPCPMHEVFWFRKRIKTVQAYFKLCLMTTSLYKGATSRSLGSSGPKAVSITHAGSFVRMRVTWAARMACSSQGCRSQLIACLHQITMEALLSEQICLCSMVLLPVSKKKEWDFPFQLFSSLWFVHPQCSV